MELSKVGRYLIFFLAFMSISSSAWSCDCIGSIEESGKSAFEASQAIFIAKVKYISKNYYTLEVVKQVKGNVNTTVLASNNEKEFSKDCAIPLELGKEYLIYAKNMWDESHTDLEAISYCSAT